MKPTTAMIKLVAILVFSVFFIACHQTGSDKSSEAEKGKMFVKVVPFQTRNGWGYNIFANDTLYIHQAMIPGVSGDHAFISRDEALQVGTLAVQKMATLKRMPYISYADLQQLHIHLPE